MSDMYFPKATAGDPWSPSLPVPASAAQLGSRPRQQTSGRSASVQAQRRRTGGYGRREESHGGPTLLRNGVQGDPPGSQELSFRILVDHPMYEPHWMNCVLVDQLSQPTGR